MKVHQIEVLGEDGSMTTEPLFELRVFINQEQYERLRRFRDRLPEKLSDDDAASWALAGALLRMTVFKDPP